MATNNKLRSAVLIFDPITGLPRDILDKPIPEELVDEHFVYEAAMDRSAGLTVSDEKYVFDVEHDNEEI